MRYGQTTGLCCWRGQLAIGVSSKKTESRVCTPSILLTHFLFLREQGRTKALSTELEREQRRGVWKGFKRGKGRGKLYNSIIIPKAKGNIFNGIGQTLAPL